MGNFRKMFEEYTIVIILYICVALGIVAGFILSGIRYGFGYISRLFK